MGLYEDLTHILGLRILVSTPEGDEFYTKHEFSGLNWKQKALAVLPEYLTKHGVLIQTLHPFTSSLSSKPESSSIWLNNSQIKLEDLH